METKTCKTTHNQSVDGRELDVSAQDLMRELSETGFRQTSDLLPSEITAKDFAEQMNILQDSARKRLERFCADGILKKRKAIHNGHIVNAYRKAND